MQADLGFKKLVLLSTVAGLLAAAGVPAVAEITTGGELEVRILWDNSGSMYPGYAAPGRPGTPRSRSGARYYHQYPEIAGWLADFVARQTIVNGGAVSMSVFTSYGAFSSGDVKEVHPSVPIGEFDAAEAIAAFPERAGKLTYLSESFARVSRDFEGLVWLITDNIVETRSGKPDDEVKQFFRALKDGERYRAIHLFKLPFNELATGPQGNLAIYGILVSDAAIEEQALRYYDAKFRDNLLSAGRNSGGDLFPGRGYWKLKDLQVGTFGLEIRTLDVVIEQRQKSLFKERQKVRLALKGTIRSNLTQHNVTGGEFSLKAITSFEPTAQGKSYGLRTIGANVFAPKPFTVNRPIPPKGEFEFIEELVSKEPIRLETQGFGSWLKSASDGLRVTYSGKIQADFRNLQIELDRSRMSGIFGAQDAPAIFGVQEEQVIAFDRSNQVDVSFQLETGFGRYLMFALLVLFVLAILVLAWLFLFNKAQYRVKVGGRDPIPVELRRLRSYQVSHEGHELGRLRRGLGGGGRFLPNETSAAVTVTPGARDGSYNVQIRDGAAFGLTIESLSGGTVATGGAGTTGSSGPARPGGRAAVQRPGKRPKTPSPTSSPSSAGGSKTRPSGGGRPKPKVRLPRS